MHIAYLQSDTFLIFELIASINGFTLDLIFVTEFCFEMALHSDLVTALSEFSKGHDLLQLSLIVTSLIAHVRRHQRVNRHQSLYSIQLLRPYFRLLKTPESWFLLLNQWHFSMLSISTNTQRCDIPSNWLENIIFRCVSSCM